MTMRTIIHPKKDSINSICGTASHQKSSQSCMNTLFMNFSTTPRIICATPKITANFILNEL